MMADLTPDELAAMIAANNVPVDHTQKWARSTAIWRAARAYQAEQDAARPVAEDEYYALRDAAMALYFAGYWACDRPCDETALWEALRESLGLPPGTSPPRSANGPRG